MLRYYCLSFWGCWPISYLPCSCKSSLLAALLSHFGIQSQECKLFFSFIWFKRPFIFLQRNSVVLFSFLLFAVPIQLVVLTKLNILYCGLYQTCLCDMELNHHCNSVDFLIEMLWQLSFLNSSVFQQRVLKYACWMHCFLRWLFEWFMNSQNCEVWFYSPGLSLK